MNDSHDDSTRRDRGFIPGQPNGPADFWIAVERISTAPEIALAAEMLADRAQKEWMVVQPPAWGAVPDSLSRELSPLVPGPPRKGIRTRTVYDEEYTRKAPGRQRARERVAAGEQARVNQGLRAGLLIADSYAALFITPPARGTLVADPRGIALYRECFEDLWADSLQFGRPVLPEPCGKILELLASGLDARGIADELGVSPDDARRYIRVINQELGARTDFEAGSLAHLRGWADRPAPDAGTE